MNINSQILTATIGLISSIIAAIFGYIFTKKREIDNNIRKEKLEYYKELINSFNDVLDETVSYDGKKRFCIASNNLNLTASIDVVRALQAVQNETSDHNKSINQEKYNKKLTELMHEIRKDLGIRDKKNTANKDFTFRLWGPGRKND